MVTTIVAAVRTFHSKTSQDGDDDGGSEMPCGLFTPRQVSSVMMTEDGISEMPLPATKVFDHLPTCQLPASAERFAFVPASAERFSA